MTLQTLSRFLARVDALGVDAGEFCTFLIHAGEKGPVTPEAIKSEFNVHLDAGERLLSYAADFNMVTYDRVDLPRVNVDRNSVMRFMNFLEVFDEHATDRERTLLLEAAHDRVDVHTRVPEAAEGLEGTKMDLLGALARLVGEAETSLVLVTPFINEMGSDTLVNRVGQATARGVDVTMITRDVDSDNSEEVERLINSVAAEGEPDRLSIYDFGAKNARLHAKSIIVDREMAYIGSANMTSYSLREAVEVGIVIEGPSVTDISEFFERVAAAPQSRYVSSS